MTTYAWPSTANLPPPTEMSWRFRGVNKVFKSPLVGHIQTASRPGSSLAFDLTWQYLTDGQRSELLGFLAKLNGQEHYMTIPFFGHVNRGALGGTPIIAGAGQTGATINTSGWPNGTLVLRRGDFVSLGGELKIITDDVTSGVGGLATLPIRPAQRIAPNNGSAVVVSDPTGTFMLENPEAAIQSVSLPNVRAGRAQIAIAEVITQP